ncbi:MAG: hypothetical protein FJ144_22040 [Deltaproteobacteria bacterium]|nr:hypothetical protein [Deltaproteobacteria bacterium]
MRSRERHFSWSARGLALAALLALATTPSCAKRAGEPVAKPVPRPTTAPVSEAGFQADGDTPPSTFPTPSGQCIFLRTIEDWKAPDPYRILVRTKVSGWQWEVLLDRRCSDLFYANALKWDTPDTRVCDYRRDAITVPGDRCIITAIRPYEAPTEPAPAKTKPIE